MTRDQRLTFQDRIHDIDLAGFRLLILRTEVEDVVSWKGSFLTHPVFERGQELVQGIAVSLLDKGTTKRDRFQIADLLENKGAQVHFNSRVLRVGFSGRSLRSDFAEVMDAVAEQLQAPSFDADEFEKARIRMKSSIQRSITQSGTRAWLALSRQMYGASHPNHPSEPEEELARLNDVTLEELKAYYAEHFGAREGILVVVGDVDVDEVVRVAERNFGKWPAREAPALYETRASVSEPTRIPVHMPDKFNIDVRMGHPLGIRRNDDVYVPLHVANFIVGGNFSSRLMDVVRDEKGLTYGIRSSLSGVNRFYEGHWQVNVTLSQDRLDEGIGATLDVLRAFVEQGATARELEERKRTITGAFTVQLATTGGLAGTVLRSIENGFGAGYLDEFPRSIHAVTLDELNAAIKTHFQPERLHVAMAGTLTT